MSQRKKCAQAPFGKGVFKAQPPQMNQLAGYDSSSDEEPELRKELPKAFEVVTSGAVPNHTLETPPSLPTPRFQAGERTAQRPVSPAPEGLPTQPVEGARILGGAMKNTVNAAAFALHQPVNIPISTKKLTAFVPNSLRTRPRNLDTPARSPASLEALTGLGNGKRLLAANLAAFVGLERPATKRQALPGFAPVVLTPVPQALPPLPSGLTEDLGVANGEFLCVETNTAPPVTMREFNVTTFYEENQRLREAGELKEAQTPLKRSHGKNQLSSLIAIGNANRDQLERDAEVHRQRLQKSKHQYGFK